MHPTPAANTDTGVHWLPKKKTGFSKLQIGTYETLFTVLGQSRKERWGDVVIGERLWPPQNTFPLGSVIVCVRLFQHHLLYASSKTGEGPL
jgi:hypothetical protein